ncbi:MAG: histidine kinase, partial [Candidatus Omnitrophica bacterium]|nr:histidine kinase [Candidatus Omnitrophota bacterium]
MPPEQITKSSIVRVLVAGFALVIILLITAGYIGIQSVQSVQKNAGNLVREQLVANRLIDEVQHQQVSLSEIFSLLARDPDSIDTSRILAQLEQTDRNIQRIVAEGMATPQRELWNQLEGASEAFSTEARRLVTAPDPETFASRDLFRRHEEVIAVMAKLIASGYKRVLGVQRQIQAQTGSVLRESFLLLGACLLMALISTVLTVRMSTQLVHRMEWQAGELSRVSWHMLEDQETTARRFSHELHDELGQSLTAVKSNLLALGSRPEDRRERLDDCIRLVDEAIGNVRQLSQLLHPTILDDFGLEAALRWLCEGFTNRT